jgi:hypothetical protein
LSIALDAIAETERARVVAATEQIAAERIAGDPDAAGIAARLQVAAQVVVQELEPRSIVR